MCAIPRLSPLTKKQFTHFTNTLLDEEQRSGKGAELPPRWGMRRCILLASSEMPPHAAGMTSWATATRWGLECSIFHVTSLGLEKRSHLNNAESAEHWTFPHTIASLGPSVLAHQFSSFFYARMFLIHVRSSGKRARCPRVMEKTRQATISYLQLSPNLPA